MASSGTGNDVNDESILTCTWVVYGVVCQIINIFGIITNIINIICFAKLGFKDSMNITLLGLAVSDLGSLITMVWSCICYTPIMMTSDLPFDPFDVMYLTSGITHLSFTRVSSYITAMITLERCLCITAPLKIKRIITPKRTTIVTVSIFLIFFCTGIPVYIVNKLGITFHPLKNKTLIAIVSTTERDKVETISFVMNNFVLPLFAFVIIVICTVILSTKLLKQAKWRKKTFASTQVDNVTIRNQKTAKMVVMISTLFIVCFIPISINALVSAFQPDRSADSKFMRIALMVAGFGYTMESINSSINICIYYHMSSNYRECFFKAFLQRKV